MKVPIAAAALAATLAVPAAAQGATLTVGGPCFASGESVPLTGTGFTPNAPVTIVGSAGVDGSATADAAGNLVAQVTASTRSISPRTVAIEAREGRRTVAQAAFPLVAEPYGVDVDLDGDPRSTVRWRFAGFPTGRPVYGHFRLRGRTLRNFRFGVAEGPCGTLSTRARRLPVRTLRFGTWRLKFDARRTYSTEGPGRLGTLRIFRTVRRR